MALAGSRLARLPVARSSGSTAAGLLCRLLRPAVLLLLGARTARVLLGVVALAADALVNRRTYAENLFGVFFDQNLYYMYIFF
jgi:hypothetical protein